MSAQVQFAWGVLLPILAFGDEVLDTWFLISNWNHFVYVWLKWACFGHLIILFLVEFIYGYVSFKKTTYGNIKFYRLRWGLLSLLNLNQAYLYWTTKRCCSSQECGGEFRNIKFQKQCKEILTITPYIHIFGEDLPQFIFQLIHLASYQQANRTTYSNNYSQSSQNVLNFVSLVTSAVFLGLGTIYFCCLRCVFVLFCPDCECNIFDCLCGRFIQNKMVAIENREQTMNEMKPRGLIIVG